MRYLEMTILLVIGLLFTSGVGADIYRWVDQKGVVHFSNYSPPDGAEVFLKEKNETAQKRSAGDEADIVQEAIVAARQEMERVLQEDRLREMNTKLDELLARSREAEARLAAAEASAAQARDLAQEALSERGDGYGPDVIYVAQPGYAMGYPLFYGDFGLGHGIRRFDGSFFRSRHFVRPFIHHGTFGHHKFGKFGGNLSFKSRFDGLTHHRSFRTIPSMPRFQTTIQHGSRGFHRARGR